MPELVYQYDPEPDRPWFVEGATMGYIVARELGSSTAQVASAVAIALDGDQQPIITATSAFTECEVRT